MDECKPLEDGDVGPNIARKLVDATRRRKGLKVRFSRHSHS